MTVYREKHPLVTAEQWTATHVPKGISGLDKSKICGCVMLGSPLSNTPHVHIISGVVISCIPIDIGDYIVYDSKGRIIDRLTESDFHRQYEQAENY